MNEFSELKKKIDKIKEFAEEFESPYKEIVFEKLFEKKLRESVALKEKTEKRDIDLSPIEIYRKINPKSNPDRALVFGYILFKHRGIEKFNYEDIEKLFGECLIPKSRNLSLDIRRNVIKGYFRRLNEKKDGKYLHAITITGLNLIKEILGETD